MGSIRLKILPRLWVALLLLASCFRHPVATCPDEGGNGWREVNSPHFRISTDLGDRVARLTAVELEQLRAALLLAWEGKVDPPGQVEVIVVRADAELEEFTQGAPLEAFLDSSGRAPLMVMAGEGEFLVQHPESLEVQAHELAHHISRSVMVRQPRWLSEGLATYLQTVRFSSLHRKATFGWFHQQHYFYLRYHGKLTLKQLWAWDQRPYAIEGEARPYYATSWLWVMYLMDKQPERFRDFRERLARAEEPHQAWEESFKDVPRLEEDFQKYVPPREDQLTVELPRINPELQVRELDCAEIHSLRARLFLRSPGRSAWASASSWRQREVEQRCARTPRT